MDSGLGCSLTKLRSVSLGSRAAAKLQKKFDRLPDGSVRKTNFQMPVVYVVETLKVYDLYSLADAVTAAAGDPCAAFIRGLPRTERRYVRKSGDFFAEDPQGTPWVMLDFDDLMLPDGVDALTTAAIDYAISKMPPEFRGASYFYQHSSSAGILDRGRPLKKGLNVHVFFWLTRRVLGDALNAYLKMHCIQTGFYAVGPDAGGSVRVRYGYDPSMLQAVQAHYTALPDIGLGVGCLLAPEARQGIVRKQRDAVDVPPFSVDLLRRSYSAHRRVVEEYQRRHGFVRRVSQTKNDAGLATTYYYENPNRAGQAGRRFLRALLKAPGDIATLYLEGESSPGSWYVVRGKHSHVARKHGGESMLLKELSLGAHAYVRDELAWFSEVPGHNLALTDAGWVPQISTFAHAKVSLILAPTGSGKTQAVIGWVREHRPHPRPEEQSYVVRGQPEYSLYVYAAPTIALVNQMLAELEGRAELAHFYKDVLGSAYVPTSGVIVTTNKSLSSIIKRLRRSAIPFGLIVDEIHVGLDEFLATPKMNEFFEDALATAKKTLLLTGTLSDVQRNKLVDVVSHALSSLREVDFCRYEFTAVKRNPLRLRPTASFGSDFISLLDELKGKLDARRALPRVVMILATSKMRPFVRALEDRGLTQHAIVVSRAENFQDEIETARLGDHRILIASPLFAVGLNFDVQADIFWCNFDHLQVDKSQIVQTLNRANRGTRNDCDVRLYGNPTLGTEFRMPNLEDLAEEVAGNFRGEATLEGLLDTHFQVGLTVYRRLRQAERSSSIALSQLVEQDAIQNFRIQQADEEQPRTDRDTKKAADEYKTYRRAAKASYLEDIYLAADRFTDVEIGEVFLGFDRLSDERFQNWLHKQRRLEKEMKDEELGLVVRLCGVDAQAAKSVNVGKLKRLFAWREPWVSAQYERERFPKWAEVVAQKTEALANVPMWLARIRDRQEAPADMEAAMLRPGLRDGLLALSKDDLDFQKILNGFENLRGARQVVRASGSPKQRAQVKLVGLGMLRGMLEEIGVRFHTERQGREVAVDWTKLLVPARWPLAEMQTTLQRRAQSLLALPPEADEAIAADREQRCSAPPTSYALCRGCVHIHQKSCVLGQSVVDWESDGQDVTGAMDCAKYREFQASVTEENPRTLRTRGLPDSEKPNEKGD